MAQEEEVLYRNGEIQLAGLLISPSNPGPCPAVAFVHGSGFSDRTNLWYRTIADHLVSQGVTVLLPDKRGSGQSTGDWRTADFSDLAGDVLAAVEFLRSRDDVDPRHVGLIAVSQGGWVASLAAAWSREVAFVVVLSGSAGTPNESFMHEVREDVRARGFPGWFSTLVIPVSRLLLQLRWKRWRDVASFDPLPTWRRVRAPVLFINGDEDSNVPVKQSVSRLEEMVQRSATSNFAIRVYQGSGHGLFEPGTTHLREDFLGFLSSWITEHSRT